MLGSNPNLDLVKISIHLQSLVKFCLFVLKILSGNEILTSFKGHNCYKFAKNDR